MRAKAAEPERNPDVSDRGWNPTNNPAARELLDHLADELAKEYIRLMKQAGEVEDSKMLLGKRTSGGRFQVFLKQERTGVVLKANRNDDVPWPEFRRIRTHTGVMCNQAPIRIERYADVVAPRA